MRRTFITILGFAAALAAGAATAQQGSIAALTNISGGVLVSQGEAMVSALPGQRLGPGQRVLTTSGGSVVIAYDTGCLVPLKENQRFTVQPGECAALVASVATVGALAAAGVIGSGIIPLTTIGVGLGVGVYQTFKDDSNSSVSPN